MEEDGGGWRRRITVQRVLLLFDVCQDFKDDWALSCDFFPTLSNSAFETEFDSHTIEFLLVYHVLIQIFIETS